MQAVIVIHHQQFVNTGMIGEKSVGHLNWIRVKVLLLYGMDLVAWDGGLGDVAVGVAWFHHAAGEQTGKAAVAVHHGKGAEGVTAVLNDLEHIAHAQVGRDGYGFLNQPMHMIFNAAHFLELLFLSHVVMNETKAAVERHGDGHAVLGDGIHVGGDNGQMQIEAYGKGGVQHGVAR